MFADREKKPAYIPRQQQQRTFIEKQPVKVEPENDNSKAKSTTTTPKGDIFDQKGHFIKHIDGSNEIWIQNEEGGYYKVTEEDITVGLLYWNNGNRQRVANVIGHYAAQLGIPPEAVVVGYDQAEDNASFQEIDNAIVFHPDEKKVGLNKDLGNFENLKVILKHEYDHYKEYQTSLSEENDDKRHKLVRKMKSYYRHCEIYLKEFTPDFFAKTTEEFQDGQVGSFANHILNVFVQESQNSAKAIHLVTIFNTLKDNPYKLIYLKSEQSFDMLWSKAQLVKGLKVNYKELKPGE